EFWQGGANRLHDRFRYLRQDDLNWSIDRLSP
ncbi:MAG: pyridoxine 5'-phosphate oxidase C-terminal domain-containing protein, partial [Halieaceae bacterium]|nr:pyridoxine 5'-phosphate oxidase C-terminal domain-containing protein [Halieaceae bacterium]